MKYAAIKKLVIDSITAQICTEDGIKRFVESEIKGEISPVQFEGVLERMRFEKKITLLDNGAFAAYFPADKLPTSFYRAGSGKVQAYYDKLNIGLPVKVISRDVLQENFDADENEEIEIVKFFTAEELTQIENLAAENFSSKDIAARLGVAEHLFARRARFHLPTRQAIADGHKKRRSEAERVAEVIRAEEVAERSAQPKPRKPKPRVCDFRPMPASAVAETQAAEPLPTRERQLTEKPPRLCACGEPLGARAHECKDCWLKRKENPALEKRTKFDAATDRKIKEILKNASFDREKLFSIALDLFLEFSPAVVKEKLAARLLEEIEAANLAKQEENI